MQCTLDVQRTGENGGWGRLEVVVDGRMVGAVGEGRRGRTDVAVSSPPRRHLLLGDACALMRQVVCPDCVTWGEKAMVDRCSDLEFRQSDGFCWRIRGEALGSMASGRTWPQDTGHRLGATHRSPPSPEST